MNATALPELVHWPSKVNGGRTTIIPSTAAAVVLGRNYITTIKANVARMKAAGCQKVKVTTKYRDSNKTKTKTINIQTHEHQWEEQFVRYEDAVNEITVGNPDIKHRIMESATRLMHLALDLCPQINSAYCGFERWEEGDEVLPDLLREGDDRPFLRRKRSELEPRAGKGEGAYRIIINTDVSWWGRPEMNAGVTGALVLVLQQFAPVEIWIQQGWLGTDADDGVSLFKLDFNGSFDPTQLSFWTGSPYKDIPFSNFINRSIGRENSSTSIQPELPCDLYVRGDWMTLHGVDKGFDNLPITEQFRLAAEWIAKTCSNILYGEEAENTN
jgi:hypothetical protein